MKIDVHVHTKKTKQGDAETREIDAVRFHEIVSATDVKVISITNHNVFDLEQYNQFLIGVDNDFQIWPGIELDVVRNERRGHLILIVSPKNAGKLNDYVLDVTKGSTPDSFTISIDDVSKKFDDLNPLYIAHYQQKKPDLQDEDIEYLIENISNKKRVLKEATNAVSAGVFISHGHYSIHGSDVHDWDQYAKQSKSLPELRLPVESFEQFCLLLDKDQSVINTLLDTKYPEEISIKPFSDSEIKIKAYNDINVFFGAKGTGKSDILSSIEKFYSSKGVDCKKFESGSDSIEDVYDLSGKKIKLNLEDYNIDLCKDEIDYVKSSKEVSVTLMSKYRKHYSKDLTNRNAQKIKIKDMSPVSNDEHDRTFKLIQNEVEKIKDFLAFLNEKRIFVSVLNDTDSKELNRILNLGLNSLMDKSFEEYSNNKSLFLFNRLVEKFKFEIGRKTSTQPKPSDTGFKKYSLNRMNIENKVIKILENLNISFPESEEYVGDLGDKGKIYCKTTFRFQNGDLTDSSFKSIGIVKKKPMKVFSKKIIEISESICSESLFSKISDLNSIDAIDSIESIASIEDLVLFDRFFVVGNDKYSPSTGESSMILLHRELNEEKDVYILDEPEKSLGNEYINEVIVPMIKDKAKLGKKIFIATHDANIAVRSLPYNSVFRYHDKEGYKTYLGNPFSNELTNILDSSDSKDWKEISMRTLEGGRDAFGERTNIWRVLKLS